MTLERIAELRKLRADAEPMSIVDHVAAMFQVGTLLDLAEAALKRPRMQWIMTGTERPRENQVVIVHGGVAQYRQGLFYTGMEDPRYARPILWPVTCWQPLPEPPPTEEQL